MNNQFYKNVYVNDRIQTDRKWNASKIRSIPELQFDNLFYKKKFHGLKEQAVSENFYVTDRLQTNRKFNPFHMIWNCNHYVNKYLISITSI